jgi:peptidyl-tRNA hydrolase
MPPKDEMAGFVLSAFDQDDKPILLDMIGRAADAATEFAISGIARSMNRFNR